MRADNVDMRVLLLGFPIRNIIWATTKLSSARFMVRILKMSILSRYSTICLCLYYRGRFKLSSLAISFHWQQFHIGVLSSDILSWAQDVKIMKELIFGFWFLLLFPFVEAVNSVLSSHQIAGYLNGTSGQKWALEGSIEYQILF